MGMADHSLHTAEIKTEFKVLNFQLSADNQTLQINV